MFCPNCGSNLHENEQTENNVNSQANNKSKSKNILSFLDDWNDWSNGKKIGSIILVLCIGLIVIGAIGGLLSPDLNTSEHRFYMTNSSFVIPDDCTIRESGAGADTAILVQKDGDEVQVHDYFPPNFDNFTTIDSNATIDVDGVKVYKIGYHYNDGLSFTDYYFNKDNIDYRIVFNDETEPNDTMAISIVKSMDTTHGSIKDHKNIYSNSNSNNDDNGIYDSYTSSSSQENSNVNDVEVDKMELTAEQYAYLAYDGTHDYTINGHKGHLYVGPYHDGGSDVDFYYQDGDKFYNLCACDDADKALEKMETMV